MKSNILHIWNRLHDRLLMAGVVQRDAAPVMTALSQPVELQPEIQQWYKVSSVIGNATGSAALAAQLQRSASQQLDAAGYALDILKSELVAAMRFGAPAPAAVLAIARPLRKPVHKQQLAA